MSNIPDPAVYRRLNRDRRISHGAFRLWHCLRDHANAAGKAWPSQRTIAEAIGCKVHSLRRWLTELVKAGYLKIRNTGQNHHFEYQLLPGGNRLWIYEHQLCHNAKMVFSCIYAGLVHLCQLRQNYFWH
jgi:hypothetical protein